MAYRGLFIVHSCTESTGPRGLIWLIPILIEWSSLSGSSVGSHDPGRVLYDPPVAKYADPVAEMTILPLMKGFSVFLREDYTYTYHYSPTFSKCKFVAFEEVEPSRLLIAYTWQNPLGQSRARFPRAVCL